MKRIWLAIVLLLLAGGVVSAQVYPTQRGTVTKGRETSAVTSHAFTLPTHVAGDLLFVVFTENTAPSITVNTGVSGVNWGLSPAGACNSTIVCGKIIWEIAATSSEALTVTTGSSVTSSYIAYAIQNGGTPSFSVTNGSSTNSDPLTLTPTDGLADYLWIVSRHGDDQTVATVAPTNFTNLETQAAFDGGGVSTNAAQYSFTGTVLDPGAFTSATEQWACITMAIPCSGSCTAQQRQNLSLLGVGP